ncbi:MAG: hypothetical protein WCR63_03495 [Bacilli bacterium]
MTNKERFGKIYRVLIYLMIFTIALSVIAYVVGDIVGIVLSAMFMGLIPTVFIFFYMAKDQRGYLYGQDNKGNIYLGIILLIIAAGTLIYGIYYLDSTEDLMSGLAYIFNGAGWIYLAVTYIVMILVKNRKYIYIQSGKVVRAQLIKVERNLPDRYLTSRHNGSNYYTLILQEEFGTRQFKTRISFDPRAAMKLDGINTLNVYLHPNKPDKYYVEKRNLVRTLSHHRFYN